MDESLSKTYKTSRGFKYKYYVAPPQGGKPTVFFAHGFPSTANSWHKQASFFREQGYGIFVPDLLGFGGTDKPTDTEPYLLKLIVGDLMEVIESEGFTKLVAIGHDWYEV